MKTSHRARRSLLLTGAAIVLAAAPQMASAQAVGAFLQPGGGTQQRTNNTSPAPSRVGSSQPGQFTGRPANPSVPSSFSSQPAPASGVSAGQMTWTQQHSGGNRNRQNQNNYQNNYGSASSNPNPPVGPANGFWNNPIPPVGPANGFWSNPLPPVGPANGFSNSTSFRVNTSLGIQDVPRDSYRSNYLYSSPPDSVSIIVNGPPLLGGYYYGGYCNQAYSTYTHPSIYSIYAGFPQYICSPNVVVVSQPYLPVYAASPQPFIQPLYSVTYNNNYYYVTNEARAHELESGGAQAQDALQNAYPANSYQAAFGDIAQAWTSGDIKPLQKHLRDSDTRLSVFLNSKYSYSIASSDFLQITRDAMDRLNTVSFDFTQIRKAKNGDVTAFGKHVYTAPPDQTMPDAEALPGVKKTVYVSYTLSQRTDQWYITAMDSSANDLAESK